MAVTSAQAGITKSWDGGDGNFNEAAKWTPDGIPGATDDVEISAAGTYVVTLSDVRTIQSLVLGGVTGTQTLKIVNQGVLILAQASTINSNGIVQWEGGNISTTGALTNAGTINVATAGAKALTGTLNNTNTILQTTGSTLTLCGGTLNNPDGGLYELQDGTLASGCSGNSFNNNSGGTFRKTTAATTAAVNVTFNNNAGGLVDVQAGKLSFGSAGTATDSEYTVAGGATLELGSILTPSGTITGTGAGTLSLITGGTLQLADGTTASIDFAGSLFQWQGGQLNLLGSAILTNAGTINVATAGGHTLLGTLNNADTIAHSGGGTLTLFSGTLNNQVGGLYDLQAGSLAGGGGFGHFNNAGTFKKITAGASVADVTFVNSSAGLVDVATGTLDMRRAFTNQGTVAVTGAIFDGPTTYTQTGGTTTLDDGTLIATNVDVQGGRLAGNGIVQANLQNAGTVAPGLSAGLLEVTGTYSQTAAGTLEIELGGTAQAQFDRLEVTGAATLDGTLDVSLISSFAPQQPDTFEVMTYASRTGIFDFTSPPIPGGLTMVADHPPPA